MIRTPLILSAVAFAALSACDNSDHTIVTEPTNPMANQLAKAPPVALPPAVTASVTFRCKDNSLAFVDFFDGSFVNYRTEKTGAPTRLNAGTPGGPFTAEGYSVSGTPKSVTITAPGGRSGLVCNA